MSPKAKPELAAIEAKFARCESCNGTQFVCRMMGRDTGRPCCPNCDHENGWRPDK